MEVGKQVPLVNTPANGLNESSKNALAAGLLLSPALHSTSLHCTPLHGTAHRSSPLSFFAVFFAFVLACQQRREAGRPAVKRARIFCIISLISPLKQTS